MVSPFELLAHSAEKIWGFEVTDIVTLIGKIPGYWTSNSRVSQFKMTTEEAQKKAKRAVLPITDNWFAALSTSYLLLANSFPNNHPEWEGKPKAYHTWRSWKDMLNLLHNNLEREKRLAMGEDLFGAVAAAQLVHNIFPATNPAPFHVETCVLPQGANLVDDFDAHFENLATTTTHGNEIVQGTLNHLTQSSTSQHTEIKKLLADI